VRIEDRVDGIDRRLDGIDATLRITTAEVKGLMQMPGIYGAEYGKIRTALEGHDGRFDRIDAAFREQGTTLREHGDKLREHDKRFDRLEELISDQGQTLREHRHLLEQILAKVA
jgi:hypothetical protein